MSDIPPYQCSCPGGNFQLWEEKPFTEIHAHHVDAALKTDWKTLIVVTPGIPELGERDLVVTYNEGFTFLATSQPGAVYFFVIFRLDDPFTWPHRKRYTDADAEALAALVADKPVTDTLLFGEVWKRRTRAAALSLEEYVLEHWHHGRIVLAGDAAHKVSTSIILLASTARTAHVCVPFLLFCVHRLI